MQWSRECCGCVLGRLCRPAWGQCRGPAYLAADTGGTATLSAWRASGPGTMHCLVAVTPMTAARHVRDHRASCCCWLPSTHSQCRQHW